MSTILAGNIYTYTGCLDLDQSLEYGPIFGRPLVLVMMTRYSQALVCPFITFEHNPEKLDNKNFKQDLGYVGVGEHISFKKKKICTTGVSFWPRFTYLKLSFPTTVSTESLVGAQFGDFLFPINQGPNLTDQEMNLVSAIFYRQNFNFNPCRKTPILDNADILL